MKEYHRVLQKIPCPSTAEVFRKNCDDIAKQLSKALQSSGSFSRGGNEDPDQLRTNLSNALREYDLSLRPVYSDDDLKNLRQFLNSVFFGIADPKNGFIPNQMPPQPKTKVLGGNTFTPTPADRTKNKNTSEPIVPLFQTEISTEEQKPRVIYPKGSSIKSEQIPDVPGLFYRPNFITSQEESKLVTLIDNQYWSVELARRTQQYGYEYDYSAVRDTNKDYYENRLTVTKLIPEWLDKLCERLYEEGYFPWKPDQIIINEYKPGQGIMPHVDHEASFKEVVASLSLCSGVIMNFKKKNVARVQYDIYLQPRSLVLMRDEARYEWTHGIAASITDSVKGKEILRKRRVSITFRKVVELAKKNKI